MARSLTCLIIDGLASFAARAEYWRWPVVPDKASGCWLPSRESVAGSDVDAAGIAAARATYGDRIPLYVAKAEQLPVWDASLDVILMFKAIYYLPNVDAFLRECRRALVPAGRLLLSSTNKDLFDLSPAHSAAPTMELPNSFAFSIAMDFLSKLCGYGGTDALPFRHRLVRPAKALAQRLDLLPKTMRGKALLRRTLFGRLPQMPRDLSELTPSLSYEPPLAIACHAPDRVHRFLYLVATEDLIGQ